MTKLPKLLVITENGRVVGTQFVAPAGAGNAPVTVALGRGSGQELHEIEMAPPTTLRTVEQMNAFHEAVARTLGAARLHGRKP